MTVNQSNFRSTRKARTQCKIDMLCIICQSIFHEDGEKFPSKLPGYQYFHHKSLVALKSAVGGGCPLCLSILHRLPPAKKTTNWVYAACEDERRPAAGLEVIDTASAVALDSETMTRILLESFKTKSLSSVGQQQSEGSIAETFENTLRISQEGHYAEQYGALVYSIDISSIHQGLRSIVFTFVTPKGDMGMGTSLMEYILLPSEPNMTGRSGAQASGVNIRSAAGPSQMRSLEQGQKWLQDCIANHGEICNYRDTSFRPTRLLELSAVNYLNDDSKIKLTRGVDIPSRSNYITLSHQWGDPKRMIKMTQQNITRFEAGISLFELPQTFRDAIYFTVACDVRYLWIDSLCIIQDESDKVDWKKEALRMADYYHNAYLNLSAASGQGGVAGLFPASDAPQAESILTTLNTIKWNVTVDSSDQLFFCVPKDIWLSGVENVPINSRGWVVQERLLSKRKLFFTPQQLFWECRSWKQCQALPQKVPELLWRPGWSPFDMFNHTCRTPDALVSLIEELMKPENSFGKLFTVSDEDRRNLLVAWGATLKRYTACNLTYHSDRLIAIESFAQKLRLLLNDDYVSGLWKSELPYQLVFNYDIDWSTRRLDADINFPSWSWAHRRAKLDTEPQSRWNTTNHEIPLLEVTEIQQHHNLPGVDLPDTGVSASTRLRLDCHVLLCQPDHEAYGGAWPWDGTMNAVVDLGDKAIKLPIDFEAMIDKATVLSLIPVFKYVGSLDTGYALVLVQLSAGGKKLYRRIGCCQMRADFITALDTYMNYHGVSREEIWLA